MGEVKVLTLPWSVVLHDNHKHIPALIGKKARLILSPEYRDRKEKAEYALLQQWRSKQLSGDLRLKGDVFMPDRRKRDAGNYRKLITDALSGIAYGDDSQIASETWDRAGYDKENPRIEITITQIQEGSK